MENLILRHNKRPIVRIIVLLMFVLVLVGLFYLVLKPIDVWDVVELILLFLIYISILLFITAQSGIWLIDNGMKIRWFSWLRGKIIPDSEIEKVVLGRQSVSIVIKGKKPMRLSLESLEKVDKTRLYEFLIEYSKQKNLSLERNLSPNA
jgi:hypothetical protein